MKESLPIHERSLEVNPQAASPLFIIPAEIRNILFPVMLAEYTQPDHSQAYPEHIQRPGHVGPHTMDVVFLRTCRRIYLETYHLPSQLASHVFWHAALSGPPALADLFPDIHGIESEELYFGKRLTQWQQSFITEIHLFTQMFWLDSSFEMLCASDVLPKSIERLKITIRAGDWWWNEHEYPFFINPHRGGYLPEYQEDVARAERGEVIPWAKDGWGTGFQKLPELKELKIEFETFNSRNKELSNVVQRTLKWNFPMGKRGELRTQGTGMVVPSQWEKGIESFCVFTVQWKLVMEKQ
ncbi:hypothetical protein R3P38DRAFT_1876597 [Favolaschia claudopus]|uniref:Uncharacterized protein n=1 Tax=Favolaschia claudopus TaxID=2862362 RepID=A0AAW0DCM1_9AGAR